MKKFCALVFCTLLNASLFVFGWHLILSGYSSVFLFYISPVLSAAAFLLLSRLFYRLIRLDRTGLWLTMNIMGEYMGWVGLSYLTERTPEMLKNLLGFMRVVLTRFAVFAAIWIAIWAASLLLHKLKEQGVNCPRLLFKGRGNAFVPSVGWGSRLFLPFAAASRRCRNGDHSTAGIGFVPGRLCGVPAARQGKEENRPGRTQ